MLWVGQFGIVDGEAQERTPWVGAFPDPRAGNEPSDLYLVVEPALPGSEEFCRELTDAIGSVFHRRKASLTGGLLRALRAAHENLREWNRKSLKEHRVAAGVSCLALRPSSPSETSESARRTGQALRQQEAYLAQVAPASAFLYQAGGLLSLEPTLPDAIEPLGLYEEFWPHFSRHQLEEGDRLLLLSSSLARILSQPELTRTLALSAEDALPALYRLARSLPNCGAVLVAALPDSPSS